MNAGGRTGGLSASLAGSDGRVLGGGVAGMLKAASPIVVGSFIADEKKNKSEGGPSSTPPPLPPLFNFGGPSGSSPTSPGGSSESGEDNDDSPPQPAGPPYCNAAQHANNIPPMYATTMGWPNSIKMLPN
ncbi:hypothetical protein OROMI_034481 [Orobanche minor]